MTLTGLLEGWWAEGKRRNLSDSTYESYTATVGKLRAFLGHDDATRVTPDDVQRFKEHRLASKNPRNGKLISPRTVKENDLAGLKSVFAWAVDNRKLPANPAAGATVKLPRAIQTRSKGFTDREAAALLSAAATYDSTTETPRMVAAKRWVPWLMAYTGARVGEMAQLRKEDVRQEDGIWTLLITPEAGRVKDKQARTVVLHPHLVELGFVRFAQQAADRYLFLKPAKGGDIRGPWRGLKNRLADFARETVTDERVRPNHAWRHRFKTVGRKAGIGDALLDHVTGHAPATVGGGYGDRSPEEQARELAKMPRYLVPEGATFP